jgi:hypothetical protein
MAHNRLLGFKVVRSTKPVVRIFTEFVPAEVSCTPRDPQHKAKQVHYPDPEYYLNKIQKYFFRSGELRHLRVAQYNRYFACQSQDAPEAEEEIYDAENDGSPADLHHQNSDLKSERIREGTVFSSSIQGLPYVRRRRTANLAATWTPTFELMGEWREKHYEQCLLMSLPWYCPGPPAVEVDSGRALWDLRAALPSPSELGGVNLKAPQLLLRNSADVSFESMCRDLEHEFTQPLYNLVCECCAGDERCKACRHALGFHNCSFAPSEAKRYRKGTLYGGDLDELRAIWNLHRKNLSTDIICEKAEVYINAGLERARAEKMLEQIRAARNELVLINECLSGSCGAITGVRQHQTSQITRLTLQQLQDELEQRKLNLRTSAMSRHPTAAHRPTDQWRIFLELMHLLQCPESCEVVIQASAGAGKSYLLETVCIWLIVSDKKFKACAPTGIAAANIHIDGADVAATTMHNLFGLDGEGGTRFDFSRPQDPSVRALLSMDVLLIDEVSMMDIVYWNTIKKIVHEIRTQRGRPLHVIMFVDFKQLPPATSKA